jgi:hypothetical protein
VGEVEGGTEEGGIVHGKYPSKKKESGRFFLPLSFCVPEF